MTGLVLIAALVATVWAVWALVQGGLLAGALLVLTAAVCFGHPFFHLPTSPVPLTADRLLWCVLLLAYFVWRQMGWITRRRLTAADWSVAALVAVLAASTLAGDWHREGNRPMAHLVFFWLIPAGIYVAVRNIRLTPTNVHRLVAVLAIMGLYLAVTAIAEMQQWTWMVYPRYIASPEHPEFLGRARGPLLNPAGTGLLEVVCLGAWLWCFVPCGRWWRLVCVGGAGLLAAGIFATLTRSVWLGAGASLLLFLAITLPRNRRLPALASVLLLGTVVAAAHWENILALKRDRDVEARAAAHSVRLRPLMAVLAWRMFSERPLLGCGFGQYDRCKIEYIADRSGAPLQQVRPYEQHSVFLAVLVETGVAGTVPLLLMLWFWTRDAWHAWMIPGPWWTKAVPLLFFFAVLNYAINGLVHNISGIPAVNLLLFFIAGLAQAARWNSREPIEQSALCFSVANSPTKATGENPCDAGPTPAPTTTAWWYPLQPNQNVEKTAHHSGT